MDLDTYLDHGEDDGKQAIVQFAARRSYRLRQPWYIEGLRIEIPPSRSSDYCNGRIDIELKRKRGKTRLRISVGRGSQSTKLAYELQSFLKDDRAFHAQCPPMCPKCGRPVPNLHARYCGRCGTKLISGSVEQPRPVAVQVRAAPPPLPSPPVSVPQARPLREPVVVERDPTPEPLAAIAKTETEAPIVEEPEDLPPVEAPRAEEVDPSGDAEVVPAIAEAEEDAIDPPEETPAEAEPEFPEEDRPRRALAED